MSCTWDGVPVHLFSTEICMTVFVPLTTEGCIICFDKMVGAQFDVIFTFLLFYLFVIHADARGMRMTESFGCLV